MHPTYEDANPGFFTQQTMVTVENLWKKMQSDYR
jgi:hypothetical protein